MLRATTLDLREIACTLQSTDIRVVHLQSTDVRVVHLQSTDVRVVQVKQPTSATQLYVVFQC